MFDAATPAAVSPALSIHLLAAGLALGLGPFAIYRRRRDVLHKVTGYVWVLAIAVTALSSFLLPASIIPIAFGMGAIHLLSIWALWTIWFGVRDARAGRIAEHRGRMAGLYWQGLTVAAVLTLMPGRVLNGVLFPARPELGVWAVLLGVAMLIWVNLRGIGPRAPS
jgi:uncharacterized membrane protein